VFTEELLDKRRCFRLVFEELRVYTYICMCVCSLDFLGLVCKVHVAGMLVTL